MLPPHRPTHSPQLGTVLLENVHVWISAGALQARAVRQKELDLDDRKHVLRERPSFRGLNKMRSGSSTTPFGLWRRVTLRLSEHTIQLQSSSFLLQILEDKHVTDVYIQNLLSTDIRIVHRSLFRLKDCIGIYNSASLTSPSVSVSTTYNEPVYLAFPSTSSKATWLALLRSCTQVEAYGAQFASPTQGGLYRIHRTLDLKIISGRNLGSSAPGSEKPYKEVNGHLKNYARSGFGGGANPYPFSASAGTGGHQPTSSTGSQVNEPDDALEDDILCTINVAGELSALSSAQGAPPSKGSITVIPYADPDTNPIWNERFLFENLPAFSDTPLHERSENNILRILVYRAPRGNRLPTIERLVQGVQGATKRNVATPPSTSPGSSAFSSASTISAPISVSSPSQNPLASSTSPTPDSSLLMSFNGTSPNPQHQLIGIIEVPLAGFRRGSVIDGFFPVVPEASGKVPPGVTYGELRLSIKFDEEIVLPLEKYSPLLDVLKSRNPLLLSSDLEYRIPDRQSSSALLHIAALRDTLVTNICDAVETEIDVSADSNTPLFRARTTVTSWIQEAMLFYGHAFLDASVGSVIRSMCERGIAFETERGNISERTTDKELGTGVVQLVKSCREIWDSIYNSRDECPKEIRSILAHIRAKVYSRYVDKPGGDLLRWQSVTAFCFLRFIVPAITDPTKHELSFGAPTPVVSRSLMQIGKVIQSLANMNSSDSVQSPYRHEYQRPIVEFLKDNQTVMNDYILVVSTAKPDPWPENNPAKRIADDHNLATNRISTTLSTMHRESIPSFPHTLDLPRLLATTSYAVFNSTRHSMADVALSAKRPDPATMTRIKHFIAVCVAIERDVSTALDRTERREEDSILRSTSSPTSLDTQFQSFTLNSPPLPLSIETSSTNSPRMRFAPSYDNVDSNSNTPRSPTSPLDEDSSGSMAARTSRGHPEPSPVSVTSDRPIASYLVTPQSPHPANVGSTTSANEVSYRRTKSIGSPSRPELPKKKSGFFKNIIPGRRDEA